MPSSDAFYTRKLVPDGPRWVIQSVCLRCGFLLMGSVTEHLREDEARHTAACAGKEDGTDPAPKSRRAAS